MKRVLIIFIMSGFAVPIHAQLGYRTLWEKSIGSTINGEMAIGKPFSQQRPNGSIVFSYPYRLCISKCSTTVVNRTILVDSTFKMDGNYALNTNLDYYPFKSGYYIQNGANNDPQTGVFYYTTAIYDPNSEIKANFKRINAFAKIGLLKPVSNGNLIVSVHENGFNMPDSIVSINNRGQVNWKYGMQSFLYNWQDAAYKYTTSDEPIYVSNQTAYIANRETRSRTDFSTVVSSTKRLVLVDSTGREKWNVVVDTTSNRTRVVGQDAQLRLIVLSVKDSIGIMSKFDMEGQKKETLNLKLPAFYNLSNVSFQSTTDNGFLLYHKNHDTEINKFNSTGQLVWQFFGFPYLENVTVYPNGNILGYSTYYGDFKLFLLAPDGSPFFSGAIIHHLISTQGWRYFTTLEKLYAINPQGEMAWSVQRPSSYGILSQDTDGLPLLTETISTKNANAANFLKLAALDVTNTFKVSKYSPTGKLLWQLPVNLPVANPNRQVKIAGGVYPSKEKKGEYLITHLFINLNQNDDIGNFNNFSHSVLFSKISRPCYENLNAALKSPVALLCEGQKLALTSNTDSLNYLSYQWQRDGQTLATTRQSTFDATAAGTYRVIVKDSVCGTSFTSAEVKIQPRAALQPLITTTGSTDFCEGSAAAVLTVSAPRADLSYQWYRDGQSLGNTFQASLQATQTGRYQLFARDSVCNATALSPAVSVTAHPLPEATVTPEVNGAVYAPFKAKLKANEGAGMTYQWYKEGAEIAGEKGIIYEAGESGSYSVRVSKEGCSRTSSALSISILQPLGVEIGVDEVKVYPNPTGGHFQLTLPQQWQKAEVELIDLMGRQLPLRRDNDHYQTEATAGAFWLRIRMEEKEIKKRLIIVR
ncbi:hypothetical protein [Runella sp.]|uniref:hypothetical protein n=1 Tax=Runella sp. TaxID=1960881 RepID=UPI003D126A2E